MNETKDDKDNPRTEKSPIDSQATQEAPSVEDDPLEAADHSDVGRVTTKNLGLSQDIRYQDGPTQPTKREHSSDYYRTYIMGQDNALHRMLSVPQTRELRTPYDVKRITLHIRGMKEHVVLTQERVIIVGRADLRAEGFKPDIDLTPYGGRDRGVSRAHLRLHVEDGKLFPDRSLQR